jgi:outer membrane protein assembly factor BamD (BamD/ComL family)
MKKATILVVFLFLTTVCFSFWEWTPETGRWINPKYAVKDTPKEQFEWAEQFQKLGEINNAIREYQKLLKHYPDSEYAAPSCFALGEIFQETGDQKEAFEYYQKILDRYPQSPLVFDAIKKQSSIAEKELQKQSFHLLIFGKEQKGDMLATVIENNPYTEDAARKSLKLGRFYLEAGQYEKAENIFITTAERYTEPAIVEEARFYIIKTDSLMLPAVTTDPKEYEKINTKIDTFLSLYPNSTYKNEVIEIQNRITRNEAKKYFEIATYYERAGKKNAAQYYYKIIHENYPETEYGKISAEKINTAD